MQSIRPSGYQGDSNEKEWLNLMSLFPDIHNLMPWSSDSPESALQLWICLVDKNFVAISRTISFI